MATDIVPLPPPAPPTPPNYHICHPFYGRGLVRSECSQAAVKIPSGSAPVSITYQNDPLNFPIEEVHGNCMVTVDWAYAASFSSQPISIIPDDLRRMASWVISTCVEQSGVGGYATLGLQNMIDWVSNETVPDAVIGDGRWPATATYFTVTVGEVDPFVFEPGFCDPAVAEALGDAVREKGNIERGDTLSKQAEALSRSVGTQVEWWHIFSAEGQGGDTSTESNMHYVCDAKLGAPSTVDCSQLAYSGLGPPSDKVTIGPGSQTKFLSFKSCHATVTAMKAMVLTWAQIGAALSTLVDSCAAHPLLASRGGRAFAGTLPHRRRRRGTAAATPRITGLDALPPLVNITLSDRPDLIG
ncbi:hypothetical protein MMC14_000581 [Varicellaria rhodocarpa]|nr:hypothetical protein [Varicellaria rhodocarpa]